MYSIYSISIKMGLWMFAGFVSFFLIMYGLGLGYRTELRAVNGIIQLWCLYRAIRAYYARHPEYVNNYMWGVVQGMRTSAIGIGLFAIFMTLFLALNPTFMKAVSDNSMVGPHLNPLTSSLFILAEGLIISLIGSYFFTRVSEDVPITKEDKLT